MWMVPPVGWTCRLWAVEFETLEIYFTYRADCRLCSGIQAGRLCVQGSCSPTTSIFSIHVTPVDTFCASKAQGTYICCLRELTDGQASQLPGHLRCAWGPYLLLVSSSCGLCCRPAWSWCIVVLMKNVAMACSFKSSFLLQVFKILFKYLKKEKEEAMMDKLAPSVDMVLYNCIC